MERGRERKIEKKCVRERGEGNRNGESENEIKRERKIKKTVGARERKIERVCM